MDINLAQILVDGGAFGIVIALLIYLYVRDKMFNKTMNNHLEHSRESDISLAKAITKLSSAVKKCPYNNKK